MATVLYDGQLPAALAALIAAQGPTERCVSVRLANVSGGLTETIVVQVQHGADTARRVDRFTLAPNETAFGAVGLGVADALLLSATDALTVDATINDGHPAPAPFVVKDATGAVKQVVNSSSGNFTVGGLLIESATNGITAFAGGGQGSAVALTTELNRVTTVATAADSVKLPAAVAGLTIVVVNKGANALAVFPATGDAIDGLSANASVAQMISSMVIYSCTLAGQWDSEGLATGYTGSLQTQSFTNAITAFAGGGQASAVLLTTMLNRVTTVASGNDSVKLPAAVPGLVITVANAAAANSLNVFPSTGDAINALGANAAFAMAANKQATFACYNSGQWHSTLTA